MSRKANSAMDSVNLHLQKHAAKNLPASPKGVEARIIGGQNPEEIFPAEFSYAVLKSTS